MSRCDILAEVFQWERKAFKGSSLSLGNLRGRGEEWEITKTK